MGTTNLQLAEDLASLLRRPDRSVDEAAREIIVTELYRRGEISRGKAAELLGWTLEAFLRHAAEVALPYVDFREEEWEAEKRAVREIAAPLRSSATPAR